jgi:hypothetical protein
MQFPNHVSQVLYQPSPRKLGLRILLEHCQRLGGDNQMSMQVYGFGFCAVLLALWSYGAGRIIMERHWPYTHSRRILQDSFICVGWIMYVAVQYYTGT